MTEQTSRVPTASDASTNTAPQQPADGYLAGMGLVWQLPLYDPLTRLLGIASAHRQLADQAELRPEQRVIEIGCGTGNLALLVKRLHPGAYVTGLDPDPKALARARRKAAREALSVELDRGSPASFHTRTRASTGCCPPSCSTVSPRARRGTRCGR